MSGGSVLPYVHPVAAGVATVLLFYLGSLALRARNDRRRAGRLLAQHARLAWPVFWLVVLSWVGGLFSTWWLRRDLELGGSAHLRLGIALVAVLTASAVTSRRMTTSPWRDIHPWLGVVALLLAAAQVFFGLQITP